MAPPIRAELGDPADRPTLGTHTSTSPRTSSMEAKRAGKAGRYLSVLKCASESGLSLEVQGRLCGLVTPRSASR
jgi:hypothetical protein